MEDFCQVCDSNQITEQGCMACGAERYEDVDGRVFWEPKAIIQDEVKDGENKEKDDTDAKYAEELEYLKGHESQAERQDDEDGHPGSNGECGECEGSGKEECSNCAGTGEDGNGDECEQCDATGEDTCDSCGGSGQDGDIDCDPREQILGEDDDPFPDPITVIIVKILKQQKAADFLQAVTELRDGFPLESKTAKAHIKAVKEENKKVNITMLAPFYWTVIQEAASGVVEVEKEGGPDVEEEVAEEATE